MRRWDAEFRPGPVERRRGDHRASVSLRTEPAGKIVKREQPFAAIPYFAWANRGPVRWLSGSREGERRSSAARSHARLDEPGHDVVRSRRSARSTIRPAPHRRTTSRRILPLLAAQGHHRRVEYAFPREPGWPKPRSLVRRYRPRRGASPGIVANALQGRRRMEAGLRPFALWRRERRAEPRPVREGDDLGTQVGGKRRSSLRGRAACSSGPSNKCIRRIVARVTPWVRGRRTPGQRTLNRRPAGRSQERMRRVRPSASRQQGEFHQDLVLSVKELHGLPGPFSWSPPTAMPASRKPLCLDQVPTEGALWHSRCPDIVEFTGQMPTVLAVARTRHWFDPTSLARRRRSQRGPAKSFANVSRAAAGD